MNKPDLNTYIARVKKLQTLARNTSNLNEAKAAQAAADKIMQEFRISEAMLQAENKEEKIEIKTRVINERGRRSSWHETLMYAITGHYNCGWYMSTSSIGRRGEEQKRFCNYYAIGTENDLKIVDYMFNWITEELARLCKINCEGKGVKFSLAWYEGAAQGVAENFRKMKAEAMAVSTTNNTTAALVVLEKRTKAVEDYSKNNLKLRSANAVHGAYVSEARNQGYEVGKSISIRQGLPQGNTNSPRPGLPRGN